MNKKQRILIFAAALLLIITIGTTAAAGFPEGSGTEGDPYQIVTAEDLNNIRNNLTAHYILMNDINMTESVYASNWVPIGTASTPFTGTFSGKKSDNENFEIQNLKMEYIDSAAIWNVGLFGVVHSGKIQNINVSNADILVSSTTNSNIENAGGITGSTNNSVIENCYVTGKITGVKNAGGVVGKTLNSSIVENCSFSGNVYSTQGWSGGIVGYATGEIKNCQVTDSKIESASSKIGGITGQLIGNITDCSVADTKTVGSSSGDVYAGGLAGYVSGYSEIKNSNSDVSVETKSGNYAGGIIGGTAGNNIKLINCSSTGKIEGINAIGGLIGMDIWGNIVENCYSTSDVSSTGIGAGGLVGYFISGKISNSFSTGNITAAKNAGGIIGQSRNADINNCYATGNIGSLNTTGGIIGYDEGNSKLTNCYALNENVTGNLHVNRIIGRLGGSITISNCLAWEDMEGFAYSNSNPNLYGTNVSSSDVWNTFSGGTIWTGWSTSVWDANTFVKFLLPVHVWTDLNIQEDATHLIPKYSVIYVGNGHTSGTVPVDLTKYPDETEGGYPGTAIIKNSGDMEKENYEFEKWTTETDGNGDVYTPDQEVSMTKSLILYAQWTEKEEKPEENKGGNSGGGTGNAIITEPKPIQQENNSGFENETIVEEPEKVFEIIKPFLVLLFFLLAIAIYLFVKRRREEEDKDMKN